MLLYLVFILSSYTTHTNYSKGILIAWYIVHTIKVIQKNNTL